MWSCSRSSADATGEPRPARDESPIRFERDMAGLAPAMTVHAPTLEHRLRIAHHLGIPAKHGVRVFGGERHAHPRFQRSVRNRVGYAPPQRPAMRFAADEGYE